MSEMKLLRKEDLSLYLYIKEVVLRSFREVEEYADLRLLPDLCNESSYVYEYITDLSPSPTERGRGWVYFDPPNGDLLCQPYIPVSGLNGDGGPAFGLPEQSNNIILYETTASGLSVVSWEDYIIDYLDGRIITERPLVSPKITFTWNYVAVVDEWAAIEASNTPVIVIDLNGTDKAGYQLGGGKKSTRKGEIHIFASDPAERNDLSEVIYDGLYNRSCPILDFPTGSVLDYDGTFYGRRDLMDRIINPTREDCLFDMSLVENVRGMFFEEVSSRHVSLPLIMTRGTDQVMLSDLNAYRSRVSFNLYSFDDRNIAI